MPKDLVVEGFDAYCVPLKAKDCPSAVADLTDGQQLLNDVSSLDTDKADKTELEDYALKSDLKTYYSHKTFVEYDDGSNVSFKMKVYQTNTSNTPFTDLGLLFNKDNPLALGTIIIGGVAYTITDWEIYGPTFSFIVYYTGASGEASETISLLNLSTFGTITKDSVEEIS